MSDPDDKKRNISQTESGFQNQEEKVKETEACKQPNGESTAEQQREGTTKLKSECITKPGGPTEKESKDKTKADNDITTETTPDGTTEAKGKSLTKSKEKTIIEQVSKDTTEPTSKDTAEPEGKSPTVSGSEDKSEPDGNIATEPISKDITKTKIKSSTESEVQNTITEESKDKTKADNDITTEPTPDGTTEAKGKSLTKSKEKTIIKQVSKDTTEPKAESSTEPASKVSHHEEGNAVNSKLILFVIMTSTITTVVLALVPMYVLYTENNKINLELHQLQTQLTDVADVPKSIESDLAATKKRLHAAEIQLGQCINTTSQIVKEIKGTKYNFSEAINKTQFEAWRNQTRDKEETTKYISSNFMSYEKWFPIIGTGLIVESLILVIVVCLYSRRGNRNNGNPNYAIDDQQTQDKRHNKADEFQGMEWVLSRIKAKKLHNKVCIISFYQETSEKHIQLTRSAMESSDALQNVEVVPVVVNKHNELLEIPACKIFIMYVDYNQRNVILEDTKKVLGDLKLTTARAIQKFNADLILVYFGYKGPRELRAEDLYNTDITSVHQHPDLKEISRKKRFLSTYKQFTEFQREHISKILNAKLL